MLPYIHIVLPTYGVCVALGVIVATLFVFLRLEKYNITFSTFICCIIGGGIGVFIGSKLLFILTQLPVVLSDFTFSNLIMCIVQSGYVFYGGLIGFLIAQRLITRHYQQDTRDRIYNLIVPAIPLFHSFGRIGCFFAGCCYGKTLPNPLNLFGITLQRYPVQLIEAFYELILFTVILHLEHKGRKPTLTYYLIPYALFRFGIEFLRGDDLRGIWLKLSTAQWISMGIVLVFLIYWARKRLESTGKS